MIMRTITCAADYNALQPYNLHAETISFEWSPQYMNSHCSLNIIVCFRLYDNPLIRLSVKFLRVENLRMETPFRVSDQVGFIMIEENLKNTDGTAISAFGFDDPDLSELPFRAFQHHEGEPDIRFEFEEFYAVLEDYTYDRK